MERTARPAAAAVTGRDGFNLSTPQMRREPRQARSRSPVEAIKQAALALAHEKGFRSLSTDQIAIRAGINIGSLYQYFPNREAIFLALHDEVSSRIAEAMKTLALDLFDAPTDKATFQAMEQLLKKFDQHRLVLFQLTTEMPELNIGARATSYQSLSRSNIRDFVQNRRGDARPRDIDRHTFFLEHIAQVCIQRYLLDKPKYLSRKDFLLDLSWILTAYMNKPA